MEENKLTKSNKLFGASTQMTPAIYKDFYKTYYAQKLKVFNALSIVIAAAAIAGGAYMYNKGFGLMWAVIVIWIGVFAFIYPRIMYKKPYKRSKDTSQTTHFSFYENVMREKSGSYSEEYSYGQIERVLENSKYFFIFHDKDSVSIIDKSSVSGGADKLSGFLSVKTTLKRIKR